MNQKENKDPRKEFEQQLLDKYFELRTPHPVTGSIQENKTTLQIQDDLMAMAHVDVYDIATWMLQHHYVPTSEADGTVSWEIYRVMVEL